MSTNDSSNNLLSIVNPKVISDNSSNVVLDSSTGVVESLLRLDSSTGVVESLLQLNSTQVVVMTNLAQVLLENIPLPSYNLTVEQKSWIQEFIRASPNSLDKIIANINTITADGKIDVHDIPAIVKLFANIYHSGATDLGLVNTKNVIAFIKFTLDVILESKLLILPDTDKKSIEAVVDASLSLLAMNIDTIEAVQKKGYGCFMDLCPSWSKKQ
jgi:hypothetical protein